jgi:hypothetical protein
MTMEMAEIAIEKFADILWTEPGDVVARNLPRMEEMLIDR